MKTTKTHLAHGLEKVYSIWIFFDASAQDSDTITEYAIEKKDVYGKPVAGGKYDYLSISFIRLPKGDSIEKIADDLMEEVEHIQQIVQELEEIE